MISMKKFSHKFLFLIIADFILLGIGFVNLYYLSYKAELPAEIRQISNKIVEIAGYSTAQLSNYETILDFHNAGDTINIKIIQNNEIINFQVELVNYYSKSFIISTFLVMLCFLIPAVFIYYKISDKKLAFVFHGMMISVVVLLLFTMSTLKGPNPYFIIIIRSLHNLSYLFLSVTFLHFSLMFPFRKYQKIHHFFRYFYLAILLFLPYNIILNYNYIFNPEIELFIYYRNFVIYFIKSFFIPFYFLVVANVIHSYIVSSKYTEKEKLLWIFISVLWGPSIFILFYIIPNMLGISFALSEEMMQILLIVSPLTLFIAIHKYNVFDIRLILKRSAVYAFFFTIIIISYLGLVYLFGEFFTSEINQVRWAGLATIILTVILYQPVKGILQKFVDVSFFKIARNLKQREKEIKVKIRECIITEQLFDELDKFLLDFIKVSSYCYFQLGDDKNLNLLKSKNHLLEKHQNFILSEFARINQNVKIVAYPDIFSDDLDITEDTEYLKSIKSELVIFIYDEMGISNSVLVLGRKSNGITFNKEDYEIILSVCNEIILKYNQIIIQKELLFKSEEIKKLEELNLTKNQFVSNVSHELKTPLTAISLFSELMLNNDTIAEEKRKEYLTIIIGECQRLTRLINNVLDFSKIDRGTKEYSFEIVNLNKIADSVITSVSYLLKMKKFVLNYEKKSADYLIIADSDSLKEVFYNLIDNAIKYSTKTKEISIKTYSIDEKYYFEIQDKGIGIKKEHQNAVFDAYFRVENSETKSISGTGLGMSIVNNIIKAHKAKITLESELGKGTKIIIEFPEAKI